MREVFGTTKEAHGVGLSATDMQLCAYGKIINARHVHRIAALLDGCGGTLTLTLTLILTLTTHLSPQP